MVENRHPSNGKYDEALAVMRQRKPDLARAADLLLEAHGSGDDRATYAIATWYLHGRHFPKSIRSAVKLLRQAVSGNIPEAMYDLAICYEIGEGMAKNQHKAVELYLKAALLGERQSHWEVGRAYYHGLGVARDRAIGRVWFDRARALGIED
jgi:uncharacterized protein